ncbi:MAG: DUF5809 family protein [Halobacteriales archaeon]|nr:DUF5809 family protein [Halobacteriales archaeon]
METRGVFAPDTEAEVHTHYETVGPAAQEVVREIAKAMAFDEAEYDDRVTAEVIETARDAIFASLLTVHIGTREEFTDWCADRDYEVIETGSENVDHVVWHGAPFAETVVAATYQNERRAAIGTLRRQAYGRIYRDVI